MQVRYRLVSLSILLVLLLSQIMGCYDYNEINKITFATSVIFDIDDMNNIYVYLDCVRPYRNENDSSDKGKRILFEGKGKTALEAIRNINTYSNNKLNFSQIRAYIFTENAAIFGLDKYIDLINNNQQFGFKPYMFVFYGDINELLSPDSEDDEQDYLGLYLEQLEEVNKKNSDVISANVNDYLIQSQNGSRDCMMGSIELGQDIADKKILLSGGTLLKDNKLVEQLNRNDALCFNILNKAVKQGTFEVANPMELDELITLEIIKSKPSTHIEINHNKIDIYKDIKLDVTIGEIQGELIVNQEVIDFIELNEKISLEQNLIRFFDKYKDKNIDILGVNRLLEENNKDIPYDYINRTDFHVNVDINIEGSNLIKDSL